MQTQAPASRHATRRSLVGLEQRLLVRARVLGCPPGSIVLVGFSGGADSLALAAALGRIGPKAGLCPRLVHVDHALRDISLQEQRRAGELAAALDLPFVGLRVGGDVRERHPGVGVEEAARRERYRLLAGAVEEQRAALVAVAHHEDDQAETVLLHLLRGAGLAGAAGMAARSQLVVPWWPEPGGGPAVRLALWRPFLAEPRAIVRAFAAGLGLEPVADPSNDERAPRRNALRHDVLPTLERVSPGATAALARFGRVAAEEDAVLEALAADAAPRVGTPVGEVRAAALAGEPTAVGRRVVRRWVRERTGLVMTADRTEAVLGLAGPGEGGRQVEIGEGWGVWRSGGALRVGRLPVPENGEGDRL